MEMVDDEFAFIKNFLQVCLFYCNLGPSQLQREGRISQ